MALGALTPPPNPEPDETTLEFPDNRLLIDLCGEFDRNLTHVESKLGVQILRRGNQLAVIGEDGAREHAVAVLEALYSKLEAGRDIDAGAIDGEIRMGGSETGTGSRARRSDGVVPGWSGRNQDPQEACRTSGLMRRRTMSARSLPTNSPSGSAQRAPARPISPWPWASRSSLAGT